MGIVKISDQLHEELRKSSQVMSRSINAQAEFWIKTGMLAELNPQLSYSQIIQQQLRKEKVELEELLIESR
ncbi:MAG: ParD-like family protein [Oceanospirillaceae bacterium]|nr:ParD-like family protein [Oceanospirillaceae bacterium]